MAMVREFNALSSSACNRFRRSSITSGFELATFSGFSEGEKRVADRMDDELAFFAGCRGADVIVAARSAICKLGAERVDGSPVRVETRIFLLTDSEEEEPLDNGSPRTTSRRGMLLTLWLVVKAGSMGGLDVLAVDADAVATAVGLL